MNEFWKSVINRMPKLQCISQSSTVKHLLRGDVKQHNLIAYQIMLLVTMASISEFQLSANVPEKLEEDDPNTWDTVTHMRTLMEFPHCWNYPGPVLVVVTI